MHAPEKQVLLSAQFSSWQEGLRLPQPENQEQVTQDCWQDSISLLGALGKHRASHQRCT